MNPTTGAQGEQRAVASASGEAATIHDGKVRPGQVAGRL
jgi:hypothetical protein